MEYKIYPRISSKERALLGAYGDIVAQLLYNRGYRTSEEAKAFIAAEYDSGIHDPFLLKDMDVAVSRILKAIGNDEKICIYSDYDADGIPGAVVLSDFFRKIGFVNFFVYIPHRNKEGFGLNATAIDSISDQGARLLITIDCGISDVAYIAQAVSKDIDVIVTDHHDPNGHQSVALATINPKQSDCSYPDKNLCGSGVIFKVVQALIQKGNFSIPNGWEKWLLDLVGIATLSDMVPLIGENRIFSKYGMIVMQKSQRKGFRRLLEECDVKQQSIGEDDVGFSIAPRINAASRMGEPEIAYRMLFTDDDAEADRTVIHLHTINAVRKSTVAAMVKEIKKDIGDVSDRSVVVKGNPTWQPSLLGLAASSIVETYKKPVFLWGKGEGSDFKGSCRSDGSVNLVHLMNSVRAGVVTEFGGHEMAGGFMVSPDEIFNLENEINGAYEKTKNDSIAQPVSVDMELLIDDVSDALYRDMQKLAPFGVGNDKPLFLFADVIPHEVSWFGKDKNHIKLMFKNNRNKSISAIKFFASEDTFLSTIAPGKQLHMLAHIERSTFGRYSELRLRIVRAW